MPLGRLRATPLQASLDLYLCQMFLDEFIAYLHEHRARIIHEDGGSGSMRLKLSKNVWRALGIPEKGVYAAHIKGCRFTGRYDTSSGLRLRIPNIYKSLLEEELERREITIGLWAENGTLYLS